MKKRCTHSTVYFKLREGKKKEYQDVFSLSLSLSSLFVAVLFILFFKEWNVSAPPSFLFHSCCCCVAVQLIWIDAERDSAVFPFFYYYYTQIFWYLPIFTGPTSYEAAAAAAAAAAAWLLRRSKECSARLNANNTTSFYSFRFGYFFFLLHSFCFLVLSW